MVYFLLRLAINVIAVGVAINLVPGLRLAPLAFLPEPFATIATYLVFGVVFAVLRLFVRPVLLFLLGRFYIWSMGLVALAADVFIFLLMSYIAPAIWQIGETRLISAIFGAILAGILVTTLEALFGLDAPRETGTRKRAFYWRWLGKIPLGRRNWIIDNLRMQQMIGIIQSHVIELLIGQTPLKGFRRSMQRLVYRRRPRMSEDNPAAQVRLMLQDLGTTFVKFGQMIASRIEILPPVWRAELERLQDNVQPFAFGDAIETIKEDLGKPLEELFNTFDSTPLAAASAGQVYGATLPGDKNVVVKVMRPDINVTVRGDLNVMADVLRLMEQRFGWIRQFGLGELFNEFAQNMLTELDYTNESYNAHMLAHNLRDNKDTHVTEIIDSHSSKHVLTEERIEGVKISDVRALDHAQLDREKLAIAFFRALLQQVLIDGFFHADPHPGNIWVDTKTGKIVFLDMGLAGHLAMAERIAMADLIWALQDRDARAATRVLVTICAPLREYNPDKLQFDIEKLINRNLLFAKTPMPLSSMITQLINLLLEHGLQLRREFTLAFKAIGQGESVMRILMGDKPLEYIVDVSYQQLKELALEKLTADTLVNRVSKPLVREALGRAPGVLMALGGMLDNFQNGKLAAQMSADDIDRRVSSLQTSLVLGIRRIVLAVLLVGLLIGSTLMLSIPFEGRVSATEASLIRVIAEGGFVFGALFIAINLIRALSSDARREKRF